MYKEANFSGSKTNLLLPWGVVMADFDVRLALESVRRKAIADTIEEEMVFGVRLRASQAVTFRYRMSRCAFTLRSNIKDHHLRIDSCERASGHSKSGQQFSWYQLGEKVHSLPVHSAYLLRRYRHSSSRWTASKLMCRNKFRCSNESNISWHRSIQTYSVRSSPRPIAICQSTMLHSRLPNV